MSIIRKISIGPDYKNGMHFFVGQEVLGRTHLIHDIRRNDKADIIVKVINNQNEVFEWKSFNHTMPVSIEYSVDF